MTIRVTEDGINLGDFEKRAGEIIREELIKFGKNVVNLYLIPNSPDDTGAYINGHIFYIIGTGLDTEIVFENITVWAPWIEGGRLPGKQPPINLILAWVRRRGFTADYGIKSRRLSVLSSKRSRNKRPLRAMDTQKTIAYRIARKIGREGQPGHYLYRDLTKRNDDKISQTMQNIHTAVLAAMI